VASLEMRAADPSLFRPPQRHLRYLWCDDHFLASCDIGIKRTESKILNSRKVYVRG
jgi:hypothetical protein